LQSTICGKNAHRIEHLVQSNLTLITQELLDAFRTLGINQIGSSYDPLPGIRGFGPRRDSIAYNRQFLRGAALLDKNKFTWGVIYVVHRRSLASPVEIFNQLVNLNLRGNPNFNPIYIYGEDPHNLRITPEEYAGFLGAIFPVWWKNRLRYPNVKPFTGMVQAYFTSERPLVCELSGQCAHEWIYIGPDGQVSQCGRSGDFNIMSYGNIRDKSMNDILQDPRRDVFNQRRDLLERTECMGCRFWGICHGGCPLDGYLIHGDFKHRYAMCSSYKHFLENFFEPVVGIRGNFGSEAAEGKTE
jgi:radical SAM protein with 4Fe4S-binding SPASM domain